MNKDFARFKYPIRPVIKSATISDDDTGEQVEENEWNEIFCGGCGHTFGLFSGDREDLSFYKENHRFCSRCGTPVNYSR